jgi:prepilin-type N-terminal cleavage/methylation domain-containing protein
MRPRRSTRRGFTLVELVLAAALTAVLLAALWTMLSTYERLFSQGQATVEQSNLVRALVEQISEDLSSAIPDTATGLPGAGGSIRRFGLFGTDKTLQVDVLQVTPAQAARLAALSPEPEALTGTAPQVPELHTVQYWLANPSREAPRQGKPEMGQPEQQEPEREELEPQESGAAAALSGLIRRELDWETPLDEPAGRGSPRTPTRPASGGRTSRFPRAALGPADPMSIVGPAADPEDSSILQVPEVAGLQFRYFDGTSWASQWNSLERKSLPVAIEVTLDLQKPAAGARGASSRQREQIEEMEALLLGEEFPGGRSGVRHRVLVWVPSTALARPSQRRPEPSAPGETPPAPAEPPVFAFAPPALPAVPPPVVFPPPPVGPDDSQLPALPDQWMRAVR